LVEKIDQRGLHCSAADDSRLSERHRLRRKNVKSIGQLGAILALTVMSASPVLASEPTARAPGATLSQSAGKVASAKLRVSQRADKASNMDGNWLIPALAIIAVIIGIIILVDSDDTPNSP
jgi:hypothetical protein